ncbi:MAG: PBP1A family penicillin-binding protein [Bacteroidota bacterium]
MKPRSRKRYSEKEMHRYFSDPTYRRRISRQAKLQLIRRWKWVLISGVVLLVGGIAYLSYLFSGLPSLEQLENPKPELATKVLSVDGEVIDHFFIKNRTYVLRYQIPHHLVSALVSIEDKQFYRHWGVHSGRVFRALIKNILALDITREGASTVTQQLARNLYDLNRGKREVSVQKWTRKFREQITAVQMEQTYTKDEILEMYFNVAYFGRGAYGIATAAEVYFDKSPNELSIGESAILVGMLRGPAHYNPYTKPERSLQRRNLVLREMYEDGYLTRAQFYNATAEQITLKAAQSDSPAGVAPHFVEYVRQRLLRMAEGYGFDIYRDGLTVYTTLDSRMQRHANRAVEEHLEIYQALTDSVWVWEDNPDALDYVLDRAIKSLPLYRRASYTQKDSILNSFKKSEAFVDSVKQEASRLEVGFVALDSRTGNILAMVGGSDFRTFKYGLNHVTQIYRQPGSAFKPFVYTVAIDNGYSPCYELLNQPATIIMADGKRWSPANSDGTFGGKSTLREGLRKSINLVAVRAIMEIAPVQQVVDYAHRMGISSKLPAVESLAMGTGEVSPLELTSAFGVFANEGVHVEPNGILRIEDKDGNVIEEAAPMMREVLSKETAYIMTNLLQDVIDHGTGIRVRNYFHLPAAGKTGTTQEFADAWFIGFTPQVVAGVWLGFDEKVVRLETWDFQGGRAAAPIWGRFMKYVYDDLEIAMPLEYFERPRGVVEETICLETKRLATEFCPNKGFEIFNSKYLPGKCPKHSTLHWGEGEESRSNISF